MSFFDELPASIKPAAIAARDAGDHRALHRLLLVDDVYARSIAARAIADRKRLTAERKAAGKELTAAHVYLLAEMKLQAARAREAVDQVRIFSLEQRITALESFGQLLARGDLETRLNQHAGLVIAALEAHFGGGTDARALADYKGLEHRTSRNAEHARNLEDRVKRLERDR